MITMEKKQSKIQELNDLLGQRKRAVEKKEIGIELDEYEKYLTEAPYEKWFLIISLLSNADIEDAIYDDFLEYPTHYIVADNKIVYNENWQEVEAKKERKRINGLTMTKRVLWLQLKEKGVTYKQLTDLIATNEDAQAEWETCKDLQRDNPLLDIMGAKLGITSGELDTMFKVANGEIIVKEQ